MALAAASLRRRTGDRRPQPSFPSLLLIDGNRTIPEDVLAEALGRRTDKPALPRQKSVVRGDSLITAISAASVLAKTWRDRLMTAFARVYPGYGFEIHKGYGTRAHLEALQKLGPCPLHRMTFRGVLPAAQTAASAPDVPLPLSSEE
ncbi:MAG: ribonuclease HII, partial [Desulfovibrio sp.]